MAAAPEVPPLCLVEQLKTNGMMVLPLGTAPVQRMVRITKMENSELMEAYFDDFSFVPVLKGQKEECNAAPLYAEDALFLQ